MATIIDGKLVSKKVKDEVANEVLALKEKGVTPGLAVIIVGDDPASRVYVNNKKKACAQVGFYSEEYALPAETTMEELLDLIDVLNGRDDINGILCQLPLPKHLDEKKVIDYISSSKDVDAFSPVNVGKIMIGDYDFLPCTPAGVMELLKHYNIEVEGKECVVIGRSNIVGKPMGMLLLHKNGTGIAEFVTADMVKDGAVVIDVGMNRKDGKLCGDVKFDEVSKKASFITPVPGGVGPMTIGMLMKNTLKAAKIHNNID